MTCVVKKTGLNKKTMLRNKFTFTVLVYRKDWWRGFVHSNQLALRKTKGSLDKGVSILFPKDSSRISFMRSSLELILLGQKSTLRSFVLQDFYWTLYLINITCCLKERLVHTFLTSLLLSVFGSLPWSFTCSHFSDCCSRFVKTLLFKFYWSLSGSTFVFYMFEILFVCFST